MRSIAFLALVALAYGEVHLGHPLEEIVLEEYQTRIFENAINESSECIRNLLIDRLPSKIENMVIDLDKHEWEHFKGKLELKSFEVKGLLGWHISELKISPTIFPIGITAKLSLDWANKNFVGDYSLNANILDHSLEGSGQISVSAKNLKLYISLQASLSRATVRKLEIKPSLEDIQFSIGQLIVDGNDVSDSMNSKVNNILDMIQNNLDVIGAKLAEAILNILNKNVYAANMDGQMDSIIEDIKKCIQIM